MRALAYDTWAWVKVVWVRYSCFVLGLVLLALLGGIRHRIGIAAGLLLLLFLSSWLNEVVREDRETGEPHARARAVLAAIQLVVGLLLVLRAAGPDTVSNVALFLGLSLITMSGAALVSEGRRAKLIRSTAPWLLGAALVLVVVTLLAPFGLVMGLALAVALVIGEVGTEFLSEAVVTTRPGAGIVVFVVSGAVVLGLCVTVLRVLGVPWPFCFLAVAAFLLLELMAFSNADSLAVIVVVALALTWASAPRADDTAEARAPKTGQDYFLVLGDSYISGEGAPRFFSGTNRTTVDADRSNECRRAPTAWPELLAKSPPGDLPNKLLFIPCSGAVTENISTRPRLGADGEQKGPAELAVFERLREQRQLGPPKVVFLSIGGNDASFGTIGTTCVGPGDCVEIGQQFLDDPDTDNVKAPTDADALPGPGTDEDLAGISDDLDIAYARVRKSVGDGVPVVVVPYPVPLGTSASCSSVLLDKHEKLFLRRFVLELDQVIESAARRHGFSYLKDAEIALTNRGSALCDASGGRSGLNFVTLNPKEGTARESLNPANWFHNSLHPNPDGHDAIRDAAVDFLRANSVLEPLTPDPDARYEVRSIDELMSDPEGDAQPVNACDPLDATKCQLEDHGWQHDQMRLFVRKSSVPVVSGLIGAWLLLVPLVRYGRSIQLSLMKVLRGALAPVPPRAAGRVTTMAPMVNHARYDEFAEWYVPWVGDGPGLVCDPDSGVLAADLAGQRWLDVACGFGRTARELARRGASVVGIDISAALIEQARVATRDEALAIEYVVVDAAAPDGWRPDRPFDGAVCEMAFMDIDDLPGTVRAVSEMVRRGGAFLLSIVSPYFPGNEAGLSSWPPDRGYAAEGFWTSDEHNRDGARIRVGSSHRMLSTYLNTLIDAGFDIERAFEPPTDVPTWLVLACRRR